MHKLDLDHDNYFRRRKLNSLQTVNGNTSKLDWKTIDLITVYYRIELNCSGNLRIFIQEYPFTYISSHS